MNDDPKPTSERHVPVLKDRCINLLAPVSKPPAAEVKPPSQLMRPSVWAATPKPCWSVSRICT
ncbi:ribosomal RNA small subunit methyltransferase H [Arthrobacter sp. Hiyo4]|nr:ribosomal RNA small subunit methyltransferase H [Arthrobacter sp. Hiyo4]